MAGTGIQLTQVTGTIKDPNGLPYAIGLVTPILVISGTPLSVSGGVPYTPPSQPSALDANGNFIVTLADVTQLTPPGATWTFHVCSGAGTVEPALGVGPVCFDVTGVVISGATQDLSAQLSAAAKPLTVVGAGASSALAGSHVLFVDSSRTDSYTATGHVNAPFKTINAAVQQINANGDNSDTVPYAVVIAAGTYTEVIDLSLANVSDIAFAAYGLTDTNNQVSTWLNGGVNAIGPRLSRISFSGFSYNGATFTLNNTNCGFSINGGFLLNSNVTVSGGSFAVNLATFSAGSLTVNGPGLYLANNTLHRSTTTVTLASGGSLFFQGASAVEWTINIPSGCSMNCVSATYLKSTSAITVASGGNLLLRDAISVGSVTVQAGGTLEIEKCSFATLTNSGTLNILGTLVASNEILAGAAPTVGAGQVGYGGTTAATASAGAGAAPPATVDGYTVINVGGVTKKIPYYAN